MALEHAEMVEILEEIARKGPATARIQAIKALKELDGEREDSGSFDALDDEISARRKAKAA